MLKCISTVESNYNNSKLKNLLVICILNSHCLHEILLIIQSPRKSRWVCGRAIPLAVAAPVGRVERIPHLGSHGGGDGLVRHRRGKTVGSRLFGDGQRDVEREFAYLDERC